MNNRKVAIILLLIIIFIGAYVSARGGGDFDVYLQAAQRLKKGENIYAPPFIRNLQYYYSVFFALLIIPFCTNVFITEFIWVATSFILLLRIKKIIEGYFIIDALSKRQKNTWLILSALLSIQFILYDISMIQITIFLLWAMLESLQLVQKGRQGYAGILLGIAINIKLMPMLLLPWLFYRGYFTAAITCILCVVGLLYLPGVFIGYGLNNFLLHEWWKVINPSNKENLFETGIGTHSIVAWLPVYLTPTHGELPFKRNLFNLQPSTVVLLMNSTRLFLLSLSICFLRTPIFKKEPDKLKLYWEISYFLLLIPLLFPHQQKYNFLLVCPMVVYLLYFFIRSAHCYPPVSYKLALVVFIISMTFYSPLYGADVIGKFLFRYTQHYRFLTFSTIFLVPIALYCNPARLKRIVGGAFFAQA